MANAQYNSYGVLLGFCLASPHLITDSWEDILASEQDGTYATKYNIGDFKPLDLGSEGVVDMQIVAFDADELADGSGNKAHI